MQEQLNPNYFTHDGKCHRCGDLGLWLAPAGDIIECPTLQIFPKAHAALSPAAEKLKVAGRQLARRSMIASPVCFDVARALTQFSTDGPCPRDFLLDKYFGWASSSQLRKFHNVIEELRRVWLLPIASRKNAPAGYWITLTQKDFAEWVERAAAAPRTQLTTIFQLAKFHWPVFGEQLELNFWNDMEPAPSTMKMAA